MSFASLHKLVTYVIAALGLYALTLGGELETPSMALLLLGFVASFFVEGAVLERPGWIRGWNAVVVAFFGLQVLRGFLGGSVLALGIEYAAFLQISRLFNRRGARDHQQIAVLAFLHLIAATVLSTGLSYGFLFLGFVIVTPWMLTLSHLRLEIEGNYRGHGTTDGGAAARVLASRRVVGPGFLVGTVLLTLPIFAVTATLFLLFPRVGLGFLSFGTDAGRRVAGFGSNVELGGFGVIRDDPTVVLRITFPAGERPPGDLADIRMRGTSFDGYDGRRWSRTVGGSTSVRRAGHQYALVRWAAPSDREIHVVLDHLAEPVVFLPEDTVAVSIPPRVQRGVDTGRDVFEAEGLDIRYLDDDELGLSYVAHVSTHGPELGVEELEPPRRALYTALPPGTDRIERLARQLTRGATDDRARAERILTHLRDSGTYRYSLELPDTGDRDPLEVFLLDARAGHCEYFSTAMAVMLRTLDIPTRNVTGFLGGRYNQYGEYFAIRQGDAHSWLEAYLDGRWVTYDPTPPSHLALGPSSDWLSDVSDLLDALRTRWNQDVVGYDLRAQAEGARRFFSWLRSVRSGGDAAAGQSPASRARSPASSVPWPLLALAAALLIGGFVAWRRLSRRRRAKRPGADPLAREVVRLYQELEKALVRRGRPRSPEATPMEHASELLEEGFEGAEAVREVTVCYGAARWGGEALDVAEMARLRALVAGVRRGPQNADERP